MTQLIMKTKEEFLKENYQYVVGNQMRIPEDIAQKRIRKNWRRYQQSVKQQIYNETLDWYKKQKLLKP